MSNGETTMADVAEPGIQRIEKSTPQWVWKDSVLFSMEKARLPYAEVKTDLNYTPYRISAYEKDLSRTINELWGLLGTKVIRRINKAREQKKVTGYEDLTRLDDDTKKPTAKQLLRYFRLFSDFVDDLGITRIEEETFKIAPSHKILHGFVKDK